MAKKHEEPEDPDEMISKHLVENEVEVEPMPVAPKKKPQKSSASNLLPTQAILHPVHDQIMETRDKVRDIHALLTAEAPSDGPHPLDILIDVIEQLVSRVGSLEDKLDRLLPDSSRPS